MRTMVMPRVAMPLVEAVVPPEVVVSPIEDAVVLPEKPEELMKFWRERAVALGLRGAELETIDRQGTCPDQISSRTDAYRAWSQGHS